MSVCIIFFFYISLVKFYLNFLVFVVLHKAICNILYFSPYQYYILIFTIQSYLLLLRKFNVNYAYFNTDNAIETHILYGF